jgi:hypothetical protein
MMCRFVVVVALAAGAAAGCGGRTGLGNEDSFASGGTPGVAGATGVGATAGRQVQPEPSSASVTCTRYCQRYSVECPEELQGQDCVATCKQEFEGTKCEREGLAALECLTPFFDDPNDPAEACGGATYRSRVHCRHELAALEKCRA